MEDSGEHTEARLRERLRSVGVTICDFHVSLFVAALHSYKRDTLVRPYPPMYRQATTPQIDMIQDDRAFEQLEKAVDNIPRLRKLLSGDGRALRQDSTLSEFLLWCLTRPYTLRKCSIDMMTEIQEKTKQNMPAPSPNFILEVCHSAESDQKFRDLCGDRRLFYGYHGSNIENFFSILNYGLQGHMSKNALFGEGTYLSSELAISLQYSPHGRTWAQSSLGDSVSCVAVCEMIDLPESVKCQTKEAQTSTSLSRSKIVGSEGGEIPETYYVVRNNDAIRVKYLLVYLAKSHTARQSAILPSWFYQNRFMVLILSYAFLLCVIAVYNSKGFRYR